MDGEYEADLDDAEFPDEPDHDDDSDDTVPCPWCGAEVYEEAERCPECGQYLSREDAPRRVPWWLILGVVLGLAVVLTWIMGR